MKLAIMQPYFFPYIGYWQLIHAVDRFVIYDDVNYIKGGWINRNRILINGAPSYITAPLLHPSPNRHICETSLQSAFGWREKLVKMIEITYRKAPFFSETFPIIENNIRYEENNLSDYLYHHLTTLAPFIGIQTRIVQTSRCYENSHLSGNERIYDICQQEGAKIYVNSQGGQSRYKRADFAHHGVELKFLIPIATEYSHAGTPHVPWLSIIDVMMFNSPSQVREMLNAYKLT